MIDARALKAAQERAGDRLFLAQRAERGARAFAFGACVRNGGGSLGDGARGAARLGLDLRPRGARLHPAAMQQQRFGLAQRGGEAAIALGLARLFFEAIGLRLDFSEHFIEA